MSYSARRRRLCEHAPDGVLVLPSSPPAKRATDIEYRYRADSNLYYLTGWSAPESVAVIRAREDRVELILFTQPRDETAERWTGPRPGPEGARLRHGADQAYAIAELPEQLPKLLLGSTTLYYSFGQDRAMDDQIFTALQRAQGMARRKKVTVPDTVVLPDRILGAQRVVKDDEEIGLLRQACATTEAGHLAAMRATRPGLRERDLEAVLDYTFRRNGAEGPANPSIVGGGANGTVLHYDANRDPLRDGDLVLVDAGAEQHHYTGDVTRTYPVNGRFTSPQRRVYEAVLTAQLAAIDAVAPGATLGSIHEVASRHLLEGLVRLGVLDGDPAALWEAKAHLPCYPHRTSHWLGLDVHDLGPGGPGDPEPALVPGMVLTIEPGLYFPADRVDLPAGLAGLGVRIEDDVLVTPTGGEVLTGGVPKEPDAVEAEVGSSGT